MARAGRRRCRAPGGKDLSVSDRACRRGRARWGTAIGTVLALLSVSPSYAAEGCVPDDVWLSSWDEVAETGTLERFAVDAATGALTSVASFALTEPYGDIALSADGATVVGVTFTLAPAELVEIDAATGTISARIPIDPALSTVAPGLNSLSLSADGRLYTSSNATTQLYLLDPVDGSWTRPDPPELPTLSDGTQLYAAGDFLTLPDGDVLAVAMNTTLPDGPWAFLVRLRADGGSQVVGRITKEIFGAAQSAGRIYLASSDGSVYALQDVPSDGTDADDLTADLTTAWTGSTAWWGAASVQDAATCVGDTPDDDSSTGPGGSGEPEVTGPPEATGVPGEGDVPSAPPAGPGSEASGTELSATGAGGAVLLGTLAVVLTVIGAGLIRSGRRRAVG